MSLIRCQSVLTWQTVGRLPIVGCYLSGDQIANQHWSCSWSPKPLKCASSGFNDLLLLLCYPWSVAKMPQDLSCHLGSGALTRNQLLEIFVFFVPRGFIHLVRTGLHSKTTLLCWPFFYVSSPKVMHRPNGHEEGRYTTRSRMRKVPLEIFKTTAIGWGVRSPVDVRKGTPLGAYTGWVCDCGRFILFTVLIYVC